MKVRDAFALVVSGLVDYTHEHDETLLAKSMFGGKTAELVASEGNLMTGVKFAEKIAILDTDAIFQDGSGCTRTSSGTTSLTQRTITVGKIAVVEDLCLDDLDKKFTSRKLKKGSSNNEIPFEQEYTDLKAATIAKQLEIAIWKGDTTSIDANLNKFDGFIKIIDAAPGAVDANQAVYTGVAPIASGTGITEANVRAIVKGTWKALPADVAGKDDIRIFCGWDTFNSFIGSYVDQNLYHFAPKGIEVKAENGEVMIPGTNYKLTAVHGLDGTNRLFGIRMTNMVEATDLEHEEEKWNIMPDQFNDYLRFIVKFKFGVQVGFLNEISQFELT